MPIERCNGRKWQRRVSASVGANVSISLGMGYGCVGPECSAPERLNLKTEVCG